MLTRLYTLTTRVEITQAVVSKYDVKISNKSREYHAVVMNWKGAGWFSLKEFFSSGIISIFNHCCPCTFPFKGFPSMRGMNWSFICSFCLLNYLQRLC